MPSINEAEANIRRGLRIKVDNVIYRANRWQPHLEVKISIETVRHVPLRILGSELFISYNQQEIGPLPILPRPYDLRDPGEGIEIRVRRDLYPTLVEELETKKGTEQFFQIRGAFVIEAPGYEGLLEVPVDITCPTKL